MNARAAAADVRQIILSKRAVYTVALMASFALVFAIVVQYSPKDLRDAMEAAMPPGSAGLFEFVWFEDVMKLFLLVVVSFGAFVASDPEEDGTMGLSLARPISRSEFLARRTVAALISFAAIFAVGSLLSGCIALAIVGDLDLPLFLAHHLALMPMLLFVIALTFLLSVPLRATMPTVLAGFSIPLVMSLTHSFNMAGDPGVEPSIFNPMAYATRVFTGQPLWQAALVLAALTAAMFAAGWVWFCKKDI